MLLLDANVLIYASNGESRHQEWARSTIAGAASAEGAAINAVCLAEICVGERQPATAADRVRSWGVEILDVPAAAAAVCAGAYTRYRQRRQRQSGKDAPRTPLPDFFIGAHAQIMGWRLATADPSRIRTYFPAVRLVTPQVQRKSC